MADTTMNSTFPESSPARIRQVVPVVAVLILLIAAGALSTTRRTPPGPAVLSAAAPVVDEQRCAECHSDITDTFPLTPHARALHHVSEPGIAELFDGRTFTHPATGVTFRYRLKEGALEVLTEAYAKPLQVEWIFGSGTHARTPLITWTDEDGATNAIEHCVSWYPDGQLGPTLGTETLDSDSGIDAIGHHRSPAQTMNCFGCHSRHVPHENGRIDFHGIQSGVGCVRCHWDADRHADEMERGDDTSIERFSQLSPREAINRCGECHRRAEDMAGTIEPDDTSIVRFAPVGLAQSRCFQQQGDMRLDCTTCHDPHRPSHGNWQSYVQACNACHDPQSATGCSSPRTEQNCLPCHMPKVPANDQMEFTDHWIRVRSPESD